jgi:hypothetical protein
MMGHANALLDQWLSLEGERRLTESLMARERERMRAMVLAKRAEAFRRTSAVPVGERLAAKRAERELAVVAAAEAEAERIHASHVQQRIYHPGTLRVTLLDGREGERIQALATSSAAQGALLSSMVAFLGELSDDRLYMIEAHRHVVRIEYTTGVVSEPATSLLIGLRRERDHTREQLSGHLLNELVEMHLKKKRELADLFRCGADSLVEVRPIQARTAQSITEGHETGCLAPCLAPACL